MSVDEETYVVARDVPFHCTVDETTNRESFTVMVNWEASVVVVFGEIDEMLAHIVQFTVTGEIVPNKVMLMPDVRDGCAVL